MSTWLKTGMPGAFFEVGHRKICTTPARESDLEVKTVKTPGARSTLEIFEVQNDFRVAGAGISARCKIRGRRGSSCGGFQEGPK